MSVGAGRLQGKHCFVTGAAQGIGYAIAQSFAHEGALVFAADRQPDRMTNLDRVSSVTLDVTDASAVERAAAEHPDISVLVNCVGMVANGSIRECSMEDFDRSMNLNVRSMTLVTRAFLPSMLRRQTGVIINIASVVSSVMAAPQRFAYSTSKAAVIGLTMSIARDYITQGIRCNCISPGTIDTPSLRGRFLATGDAAAAEQAFTARQPMGRLGSAAEVAAAAILLASDEAPFMTGSNLVIDGGMSL
jgi:2-keto-3-deoxy-L-fuconate dehydrogenase